ncbi:MAG: GPW/gp25 family protein [Niabella sp.]
MKEYLKLPLSFNGFFEGKKITVCDMANSIYRNLHLLITTSVGENKFDEKYGSSFWDNDYDIHLNNDSRRALIINDLKQQIALYEKRLTDVYVEVTVRLSSFFMNTTEIQRRKVEIIVKGKIIRSMEPLVFKTGFYIGPLTLS